MAGTTQFVMIRRASAAVAEYDGVEHDDDFTPGADKDGFTYGSCAASAVELYCGPDGYGWEEVTDLQLIDNETGHAVGGVVMSPDEARAELAKAAERERLGLLTKDERVAAEKAADEKRAAAEKVAKDLADAAAKEAEKAAKEQEAAEKKAAAEKAKA